MADADRNRRGRHSIAEDYFVPNIPLEMLLTKLADIFAHVTKKRAVAAGWCVPLDGLPEFFAQAAVNGLWANGEMALWGRLSVAGGELLVRPDKPYRHLRRLERIPVTTVPLRQGEGREWIVDDGEWCWVDIHVTHRGSQTAVAEARDMRRRIGESRKPISVEALEAYVKAHEKLGRPRIYKALRTAGYGVTTRRVEKAVRDRDAGKRLKGGRERQG